MKIFSNPYGLFTTVLGALMVFVYAGLGAMFLFYPDFANMITGVPRKIVGIMLILYSFFRIYRIIRSLSDMRHDE
jgi:hypothetical protein